jgi:hypothetical protein
MEIYGHANDFTSDFADKFIERFFENELRDTGFAVDSTCSPEGSEGLKRFKMSLISLLMAWNSYE